MDPTRESHALARKPCRASQMPIPLPWQRDAQRACPLRLARVHQPSMGSIRSLARKMDMQISPAFGSIPFAQSRSIPEDVVRSSLGATRGTREGVQFANVVAMMREARADVELIWMSCSAPSPTSSEITGTSRLRSCTSADGRRGARAFEALPRTRRFHFVLGIEQMLLPSAPPHCLSCTITAGRAMAAKIRIRRCIHQNAELVSLLLTVGRSCTAFVRDNI
ncbi:hypothetical protein B0H19DRAFT_654339 [Mycena capillaripes]|nr:hypothetical protein B0H19DRAFT_654339 [Mycena capillaripes]